jgi:hypothetical protein
VCACLVLSCSMLFHLWVRQKGGFMIRLRK